MKIEAFKMKNYRDLGFVWYDNWNGFAHLKIHNSFRQLIWRWAQILFNFCNKQINYGVPWYIWIQVNKMAVFLEIKIEGVEIVAYKVTCSESIRMCNYHQFLHIYIKKSEEKINIDPGFTMFLDIYGWCAVTLHSLALLCYKIVN